MGEGLPAYKAPEEPEEISGAEDINLGAENLKEHEAALVQMEATLEKKNETKESDLMEMNATLNVMDQITDEQKIMYKVQENKIKAFKDEIINLEENIEKLKKTIADQKKILGL